MTVCLILFVFSGIEKKKNLSKLYILPNVLQICIRSSCIFKMGE